LNIKCQGKHCWHRKGLQSCQSKWNCSTEQTNALFSCKNSSESANLP